jgi:large subunit ribosomal protein L16
MMQPKRTKYRKMFKGNLAGSAHRGSSVAFGDYGLKAMDRSRMTARDDALREARRPDLDPRVPRRADHAEAA